MESYAESIGATMLSKSRRLRLRAAQIEEAATLPGWPIRPGGPPVEVAPVVGFQYAAAR